MINKKYFATNDEARLVNRLNVYYYNKLSVYILELYANVSKIHIVKYNYYLVHEH